MSDFVRELAIFSCLLFTSFCFWKVGVGLTGGVDASVLPSAQAAIHSSVTPQRFQTTPIQKMRPGMRGLGRNPDRWDTQSVVEPDPVSWRLVSVRMEHNPGEYVLGKLLRPTSWIRGNQAQPGSAISLEIPEMNVSGVAEVLSIEACPLIKVGPGSVVTGTFEHVSNNVISVFVEGEVKPIGTTAKHPFWSKDRSAFVPAGELRIGEELKTALGTSTRVTSIEIRAGPETVYGLEVAGEHVYQIADAGLLVHNASVGNNATRLGANSRVNHSRYYERKILRGDINKASRPTDRVYRRKHLNARTDEQARELSRGIGTSDRRPEASYLPEFIKNLASLEKKWANAAVRQQNFVEHGGTRYLFYKSETPVGYNNVKLTNWIRIEIGKSGKPTIHSHPSNVGHVREHIKGAR